MDAEPSIEAPDPRRPLLFCVGGLAVAVVAIGLAAAAGPPYLSFGSLNPWLVVYAIGLFTALFAVPFAIHARLGGELESDARWERSLLLWGLVALGALGLAVLVALAAGGFGSDSLAGSVAAVTLAEAVLVLGSLIAWLLSN
ncbi:MAG: hypothetical protein ACJ75R_06095 [Solirubrobacterales bacterium]